MAVTDVKAALLDAQKALEALLANEEALNAIEAAGQLMADTIAAGGKILSCGNGGSLCDSMHFAEEMTGRYRLNRPGFAALAISAPSHMSCVGNDYGYEEVFARYTQAVGRPGDVLLAITTSGTSKNILKAVEAAKANGMKVVGMTGRVGSPLAEMADIAIVTPSGSAYADRVQELHIKAIHIMIELVERRLAPENYAA